jgi:ABC-type amino acid transport substrate-binding protein
MIYKIWIAIFLFLASCSCESSSRKTVRIGIDPQWSSFDFGSQVSYVNGFTEDLLLEMARYSGLQFEVIWTSWDTLLDGLKRKEYDAIFSSMPPYEYNKAKYDFSMTFLNLGPVLIVRIDSEKKDLSEMNTDMVGVLSNSSGSLILQSYSGIIVRNFSTIPQLLNSVSSGEVDAALLTQIPAVNFVQDLYANRLKIVGQPLDNSGLRLVSLKGSGHSFSKTLEALKKKNTVEALLKKWNLGTYTQSEK